MNLPESFSEVKVESLFPQYARNDSPILGARPPFSGTVASNELRRRRSLRAHKILTRDGELTFPHGGQAWSLYKWAGGGVGVRSINRGHGQKSMP